jgi:hypothetical protein
MRLLFAALIVLCSAGAAEAQRGVGRPSVAAARGGAGERDDLDRRLADDERERRAIERAARRIAANGYGADDVLAAYDRDSAGRWFKRGEIVIATADPAVFATAARLGLRERRRTPLASAAVDVATYVAPERTDMPAAVAALRAAHPEAAVDLNYIYAAQGETTPIPPTPAPTAAHSPAATVALIDGALTSLPGVDVTARRFADGPPAANGHAAAVATILARAANVAMLRVLAADVIAAGPIEAAAADDIARALDWAALEGAGVINVSLTGPPSMTLALVARALAARGCLIVAAAGNDGPRAAAPFPAALPGVIGVTAVDARGRVWRRATRGPHVDFAALGVRIFLDGEHTVTGTSYAAPVVAGLLARRLPRPDPNQARLAQRDLESRARDLGAPGRDPVFGAGLVDLPE